MPELHIHRQILDLPVEPFIADFALAWNCEWHPIESGYLLLPEIILRKYGVFIFPMEEGWRICREDDATTWEDYLFMLFTHQLAAECGGRILYEGERPLPVAPHKFATFEAYVETVLERVPEVLKDVKRQWIYNHRKRAVR